MTTPLHPYSYTLFGYTIHCDMPLLGLLPVGSEEKPGYSGGVCVITLTTIPGWVSGISLETKQLWADMSSYEIWTYDDEAFFEIDYKNSCKFIISGAGDRIYASWDQALFSVEDILTYLIGPIAGFILSLRSIPALHASVITINSKAVAFVGDSGRGKSTLALTFARLNIPVISEDIAPLYYDPGTQKILIPPGYRIIKVWADIADRFFQASLPQITPTWDKRFYSLPESEIFVQAVLSPPALTNIYYLQPRAAENSHPQIELMSAMEAFKLLWANLYTINFNDSSKLKREFEIISQVANQVIHKSLTPINDLNQVEGLCKLIIQDLL